MIDKDAVLAAAEAYQEAARAERVASEYESDMEVRYEDARTARAELTVTALAAFRELRRVVEGE